MVWLHEKMHMYGACWLAQGQNSSICKNAHSSNHSTTVIPMRVCWLTVFDCSARVSSHVCTRTGQRIGPESLYLNVMPDADTHAHRKPTC